MARDAYDWTRQWETARRFPDADAESTARVRQPPFDRDYSRLVRSLGFSSLQGKSLECPPVPNARSTSRAAQAVEIAMAGRAIAQQVDVPAALVEAVCLARALGCTPFGPAGEQGLAQRMHDWGGFSSRAQAFRAVTRLAQGDKTPGLNLCRATLLGMLCRAETPEAGIGDVLYQDDLGEYRDWLYDGTPLRLEGAAPTVIGQIADWAVAVVESTSDLGDAILGGSAGQMPRPSGDLFAASAAYAASHEDAFGDQPSQQDVRDALRSVQRRLESKISGAARDEIRAVMVDYHRNLIRCVRLDAAVRQPSTSFELRLQIPAKQHAISLVLMGLLHGYRALRERSSCFEARKRTVIELFDLLLEGCQPPCECFPVQGHTSSGGAGPRRLAAHRCICDRVASLTDEQAVKQHALHVAARAEGRPGTCAG